MPAYGPSKSKKKSSLPARKKGEKEPAYLARVKGIRAAAKPKPKPPTASQRAKVKRDNITKQVAPSGFQRLLKALGM